MVSFAEETAPPLVMGYVNGDGELSVDTGLTIAVSEPIAGPNYEMESHWTGGSQYDYNSSDFINGSTYVITVSPNK